MAHCAQEIKDSISSLLSCKNKAVHNQEVLKALKVSIATNSSININECCVSIMWPNAA
jgi:hypothetical protein